MWTGILLVEQVYAIYSCLTLHQQEMETFAKERCHLFSLPLLLLDKVMDVRIMNNLTKKVLSHLHYFFYFGSVCIWLTLLQYVWTYIYVKPIPLKVLFVWSKQIEDN